MSTRTRSRCLTIECKNVEYTLNDCLESLINSFRDYRRSYVACCEEILSASKNNFACLNKIN